MKPTAKRTTAIVAVILAEVLLLGLGVWQIHRRSWKHALIARVEARVHAPATAPPSPRAWPHVDAADDEYRHVSVSGRFLNDRETLVQALTELGGGFWVMTPLQTANDGIVLVNRGFVPTDKRDPQTRTAGERTGEQTVTGLLRMSEPGGSLLRRNDPAADRWYSRDVPAIAAARGLTDAAPYFIDADAAPNRGGLPVGGLTVVTFPDNHLIYALTWFSLAALLAGWVVWGRGTR